MKMFTVKQASEASGLSPGQLRLWELRYGWPMPKRGTNRYRCFTTLQVEDLRRVAELIQGGMSIGAIIYDGAPRWPSRQHHHDLPHLIEARRLPPPIYATAVHLQKEIFQAIEAGRVNVVEEILHRAMWLTRPQDEVITSLAPILLGIAELEEAGNLSRGFDELPRLVEERCVHLLRRFRHADPIEVVPLAGTDRPLAALIALVWNMRGKRACLRTESQVSSVRNCVAVGRPIQKQPCSCSIIDRIDSIKAFCVRECHVQAYLQGANGCV